MNRFFPIFSKAGHRRKRVTALLEIEFLEVGILEIGFLEIENLEIEPMHLLRHASRFVLTLHLQCHPAHVLQGI